MGTHDDPLQSATEWLSPRTHLARAGGGASDSGSLRGHGAPAVRLRCRAAALQSRVPLF